MSHRFISATYQLYIEENGQEVLKEQITEDQPLSIYTEIGMLLPSFETRLAEFVTGDDYDFVLPHAEAYGEYDPKGRATLSKKMFSPDGVFDEANVFAGAVIPLADENGQRHLGYVVSVDDDTVTVDMNHPLAGKDLHFKGRIIENRPATEEEVNDLSRRASSIIAVAIAVTAVAVVATVAIAIVTATAMVAAIVVMVKVVAAAATND